MRVLIIGSGGREHALAWKIAQSPLAKMIYVAPGNAGTACESHVENIALGATNIKALADFAKEKSIALTIVGPEVPLATGITDYFQSQSLAIVGPTRVAARLESSKKFSKDFMHRYQIPTAQYQSFDEMHRALNYLKQCDFPIVIKADGLAAGKGVVIAETQNEANTAVIDMLSRKKFGESGNKIIIEEFLEGEEVSFICLVDGENALPLATSQDHKARDEGDRGPNTGGMGAFSPAPMADRIIDTVMQQIINPVVNGMREEGSPFHGFLYAGLMIDKFGQAKVLEFNCRLGDPETQAILLRMNFDLLKLCQNALENKLSEVKLKWDPRYAVCVVLAANGYPEDYEKGHVINGLDTVQSGNIKVFHAGTIQRKGQIVTNGGRVLCVTALGDSIATARQQAYHYCDRISWKGMFYRRDIGS